MGRLVSSNLGHLLSPGAPRLGWVGCLPQGAGLHLSGGTGVTEGSPTPLLQRWDQGAEAAWAVGVALCQTDLEACSVSYRNLAAAKGFLGQTVHSVRGASPTPVMAKAT